MRRWVAVGFALGMVGVGAGMGWAGRRATLACRLFVARDLRELIHAGLAEIDHCHETRHEKPVDCNVLDSLAFQRAQFRAQGIVNAFCLKGNPVLQDYPLQPGSDIVTTVAAVVRRRIEASGKVLQQSSAPGAGAERRCRRAIGRARTALIERIVRRSIRCQTKRDRHSSAFGALEAACLDAAPGVAARGAKSIARACSGLTGANVGSCDPLPDCVLASALTTGQALARDVYGALPEERGLLCGNGVIDAGEECDDGNRNDNDACTNACAKARCGDKITETGVEECDDGNNTETDGCTPLCKLARCGDGIVQTDPAGIEQCDDGPDNGRPGDVCDANCQFVQVACSPSGALTAAVTLIPQKDGSTPPFAGLQVTLGYPKGLSFPGSGALSVDDPADPATRIALFDLNLYQGLVFFFDTDVPVPPNSLAAILATVAASSETPISAPVAFERVRFDCTPGVLFSPAQMDCEVTDYSNKLGTVTSTKWPTCTAVLEQ